jgi:hypothetical protein
MMTKASGVDILQTRFSASAAPRALWLVCYLVAVRHVTACSPTLHPELGSPTMCYGSATLVMLHAVAVPVFLNRNAEQRERREFFHRSGTLHAQQAHVAN